MGKVQRRSTKRHTTRASMKDTTSSSLVVIDPRNQFTDLSTSIIGNPQSCCNGLLRDHHRILLIGCGDFSWPLALLAKINCGARMVATSLDSLTTLLVKYGEQARINIQALRAGGVYILHGIDATSMFSETEIVAEAINVKDNSFGFDRIVFTFPHTGGQNVQENQSLISGFLHSARSLLRNPSSRVLIALRTTPFYTSWNLSSLADDAQYTLTHKHKFNTQDYLGYTPRRTHPAKVRQAPEADQACMFELSMQL